MENHDGSIYEKDTVYRPIFEKDSALLEVALGCSYRRCVFCDFIRDEFRLLPLETILNNIHKLAQREPDKTALFLLGQNALCIKTEALLAIFEHVKEHMPNIREINLYGRVDDINRKGAGDLARLKNAGLGVIHIGVESGSDAVLTHMNKGITLADTLNAFQLLDQLQIHYHITYILGLGGKALWRDHVEKTYKLLNKIQPVSIWALGLKVWPGTPLELQVASGEFIPLSWEEMLTEEKLILEQLHYPPEALCLYLDTTALGQYTVAGVLPEGKENLLQEINKLLKPYDMAAFLNS